MCFILFCFLFLLLLFFVWFLLLFWGFFLSLQAYKYGVGKLDNLLHHTAEIAITHLTKIQRVEIGVSARRVSSPVKDLDFIMIHNHEIHYRYLLLLNVFSPK